MSNLCGQTNQTSELWCPNPSQWLDITIQFQLPPPQRFGFCGFACCSQCWATADCLVGTWTLGEMARPDFCNTLMRHWNNERLRAIRADWLTGRPQMCEHCSRLAGGVDPPVSRDEIDKDEWWSRWVSNQETRTFPRVVSLNYDPSCNLCCPSCRRERIWFGPNEEHYEQLLTFQSQTVKPLLRRCIGLHAAGYGDPFASPLYRMLLQEMTPEDAPELKLYLLTNGLGFTKGFYDQMPLRDRIASMCVSIDAACEETYKTLRGGSWSKLQANLDFVSQLRQDNKIGRFELGFVFQRVNWHELSAFVDQAVTLRADRVVVYTLLQHAHNNMQYTRDAVHLPEHPQHMAAMDMLFSVQRQERMPVYVELPNPERAGLGLKANDEHGLS